MIIDDPSAIRLDDDVEAILDDLTGSYGELNELRNGTPTSPTSEASDNFRRLADAVHDSAAIEGLAGSRRETHETLQRIAEGLPPARINPTPMSPTYTGPSLNSDDTSRTATRPRVRLS